MSDEPKPRKLMKGDLPNYFAYEPRFETHRLVLVKFQGEVFEWPHHHDIGLSVFYRLTDNALYVATWNLVDPTKGPEIVDLVVFPRALTVMKFEPRKKEKAL